MNQEKSSMWWQACAPKYRWHSSISITRSFSIRVRPLTRTRWILCHTGDWGSMTSSPHLKMMWNSPRNPVGALVTEESRKELWEAMHAEGEGVDLGDTVVYPVMNTKENRQVGMMWNGEVKRFKQGTRLEHP